MFKIRTIITIALNIILIVGFYSCSFPDDFIQPTSTYKESAIIGDFLYQVEGDILSTFDISEPSVLKLIDEQQLNAIIESLVSFSGVLFIGSGGSLISFTINENGLPVEDNIVTQMTFSTDQTECDQLSITNDIAFVALIDHNHINNLCNRSNNTNTVQVYDIESLSNPVFLASINLNDVKDIATDAALLFVSDGSDGFKIYDTSDPSLPLEIYHIEDFSTNDMIVDKGMLIVAGPTELRQYDYSDITNLRETSRIEL
jgi:hypothetical protein